MNLDPVREPAAVDVAVLGAGPAGVASACGLARLGYSVALLDRSRADAIEGLSERTLAELRSNDLHVAAASVSGPCPRTRSWGGQQSINGTEFLVRRASFDQALREDAARLGVGVQSSWVVSVRRQGECWEVQTRDGRIGSRAVVEARGRRARGVLHLGPRLFAVAQRFRSRRALPAGTSVFSLADSWCWFARDGGAESWLQVIAPPPARGSSSTLSEHIARVRAAVPEIARALDAAEPVGDVHARAAVARMSVPAAEPGFVRVGDAAIAMDPLTGHGIYEALTSARVAVAAIHTYLDGGDWDLVRRFVNERCQDLWQRRLAAGSSFYDQASGGERSGFWRRSAAAYALLAAASAMREAGPVRIELRPVLNGQRIEQRRVVVTPQRPRGSWLPDPVDLASLVDRLRIPLSRGG